MFRWVKSHQELIGGLAAVMAATAVIWTALQQRQHAIDDRTEQQEQELEGALLGLKLAALRLEFSSNLQVPPAKLRTLVDNLRAAADNLPRTAQRLSVHTNINCSAADAFLDIIEGGTKDGEAVDLCTLEVRRMAFTMAAYMTKHERLLDGAKYVHNPKLLSKGQAATAAELGITADLDDPYLREWLAL